MVLGARRKGLRHHADRQIMRVCARLRARSALRRGHPWGGAGGRKMAEKHKRSYCIGIVYLGAALPPAASTCPSLRYRTRVGLLLDGRTTAAQFAVFWQFTPGSPVSEPGAHTPKLGKCGTATPQIQPAAPPAPSNTHARTHARTHALASGGCSAGAPLSAQTRAQTRRPPDVPPARRTLRRARQFRPPPPPSREVQTIRFTMP